MRGKEKVSFEITDSGKGIEPELLPKAFEMFQQGCGGPLEVLVWDWRFLKQSSRAMAAKIYASSKGSETGAIFTIELKLRKTKHRKHHSFHSNAAASSWTRRTNCDIWNLHRSAPA